MHPPPEVVSLSGVTVVRQRRALLSDVDWTVHAHERWVVLGPNGAGKTTMLQVASTYLRPSRGTVRLLGRTHGAADVRELRRRVGYAGPAPAAMVREYLPAREVVVTGKHAAFVDSRWHDYDTTDWQRAARHLERLGAAAVADQSYGTLSAGERQRVLIARSLMTDPDVLLLDEAMTGLDLGAREELVATLSAFAADDASPAVALVTHHVEEIPPGFTHLVMLRGGRVVTAGAIDETLDAEALSATFGVPLTLERVGGRYRAQAR
jgi:iron complex transport system ATP-binding protein